MSPGGPTGHSGRSRTKPPRIDVARLAAYQVVHAMRGDVAWDVAWRRCKLPSGSLDRRFAQELASGSVRMRARLDHLLGQVLSRKLTSLQPEVHDLLRLGAYQILEADRTADRSAVHSTVELAKQICPRATGLINAVLRALLRRKPDLSFPDPQSDPIGFLSSFHSHPEWLVQRWLSRFGFEATEALCRYDNRRPELCLRVNRLRTSPGEVLQALPGSVTGRWTPWAVRCPDVPFAEVKPLLDAGNVSVQDESGIVVGEMLAAQPGERWLDLAAAPGGKACHLAEAVGESGSVLALDVSPQKLQRIRENVERLALGNVLVALGDARELQHGPCDGVLLDAPCSGLGVLARRPDARWRKQPADLPRLARLQAELLQAARRFVRPGGRLIYSVCSFEPEETTAIVEAFSQTQPEFELETGTVSESLQETPGVLYFFPQRDGIDGGFVARWRRRSKPVR